MKQLWPWLVNAICSDRDRALRFFLVAASSLLLASAFPPLDFAWAGWISLTPLTCALVISPAKCKVIWKEGLLFGALFFLLSLFWLTEVSWLGWFALSGIMSVYLMLWVILIAPLFKSAGASLSSLRNLNRAGLGAFLWVGLEWVRGWMATGFPWNYLGVSQWRMVGVIQIAEWGGTLLVSWLVAFIAIVLGLTIVRLIRELGRKQRIRPHFEFTLGMLLLGCVILFGIHVLFRNDSIEKQFTVLAVQPDLPQDPWKHVVSLEEAVAKMEVLSVSGLNQAKNKISLVVWPETPIGEELYSAQAFREALQAITLDRKIPLLAGSSVYAGPDLYNAAMLYPAGGGPPQLYYKNHLVLMGEVVPFSDWIPFINYFVPLGQNFTPGSAATVLSYRTEAGEEIRMAPLICFEDTFGRLARRYAFAEPAPDILVNITNDGWFKRSFQSRQHLANAVFRAVENRMPLLRVSNNGITALIDHKGILKQENMLGELGESSSHDAGTLRVLVSVPEHQLTLYQQYGNWVGILGAIAIVCYLPLWWRSR